MISATLTTEGLPAPRFGGLNRNAADFFANLGSMLLVVLVAESWGLLLGGIFMHAKKAQTATTGARRPVCGHACLPLLSCVGFEGRGRRGGRLDLCPPRHPCPHIHSRLPSVSCHLIIAWRTRSPHTRLTHARLARAPCTPPPAVIMLTFLLVGGYYARSIPVWIAWVRPNRRRPLKRPGPLVARAPPQSRAVA